MDISVIICTYNRIELLRRTIASATKMNLPDVTWELLVVDNGGGDEVQRMVDEFAAQLPLRVVNEPRAGLSRARNCGIRNARSDYIVWTDDDVILDRNWLKAYADAFKRHPDAVLFGGKIIPVLEQPASPWFERNLDLFPELLSYRDFGPDEQPLSLRGLPYGANYAMRAAEQRRFPYNVNLGAGSGTVGEETRVMQRMLESGMTGYWLPDFVVQHMMSPNRQTIKYVIDRYKAQGATEVYFAREDHRPPTSVAKLWARFAVRYILYATVRPLNLERLWISRLKGYAFWKGALEERLREREFSDTPVSD